MHLTAASKSQKSLTNHVGNLVNHQDHNSYMLVEYWYTGFTSSMYYNVFKI